LAFDGADKQQFVTEAIILIMMIQDEQLRKIALSFFLM
jgi:hypothetical protein